jgi:hypothetical protein
MTSTLFNQQLVPHNAEQIVLIKEVIGGSASKDIGTTPFLVANPLLVLKASFIFDWVRPHQVADS